MQKVLSQCFLSLNHRRVKWIRGRTQSVRVLQPCQWNLDETTWHASQESIPWTNSLGRQPVCCRWGKDRNFTVVGCDSFGQCHRSRALARAWSRKSVFNTFFQLSVQPQKYCYLKQSLLPWLTKIWSYYSCVLSWSHPELLIHGTVQTVCSSCDKNSQGQKPSENL